MLQLEKYSIGVGDRFAHQAKAQLRACIDAAGRGIDVVPVWNKSFREHGIVGSRPESVREAADRAVRELGFSILELSRRLGVSKPTISQSVKRGVEMVKQKALKLSE